MGSLIKGLRKKERKISIFHPKNAKEMGYCIDLKTLLALMTLKAEFANTIDSDEIAHTDYELSHLDLHCLLSRLLMFSAIQFFGNFRQFCCLLSCYFKDKVIKLQTLL